jgi:replication-associated recombination protein RarA
VGEPFDLAQEYLPKEIAAKRFYDPSGSGAEAKLRDRIAELRAARTSSTTREKRR